VFSKKIANSRAKSLPKAQKTDIISGQRKVEIKALALWRQPCFMAARVAS
jgi:hypothetical protein